MVSSFRYLARTLTSVGDDWPAIITNFWKAYKVWDQLSWILGR